MFRNSCNLPIAWCLASAALAAGCQQDMADQPRYEPLEASDFFADGMASRPLVEGTVARGHLRVDDAFYRGNAEGQPVKDFPLPQVAEKLQLAGSESEKRERLLLRGHQRFDIFCAPCHGRTGNGNGMVVQRGFPAPPSLHLARLREAPVGHFYDVITRGFGRMSSYDSQIPAADRWAIVAYVRALQLSQHAVAVDLPAADREQLPQERSP